MTSHLSQLIFEALVVSLLFSALCLMQITELPFQWTHFFIAAIGSLSLYGFKRIAAVCLKSRPNSPSLPCADFGGGNITTVQHDGAFTIRGTPLYWIALLVLRFTALQKRVVSVSLTTNNLVIVH